MSIRTLICRLCSVETGHYESGYIKRARIWLRLWLCSQCGHVRGESL